VSTKRGRITELIRVGPKFAQLRISSGEKVELPLALWELAQTQYGPDQDLVFVERRGRIFSFVQWVGTDSEAAQAVRSGELREREYGPAPDSSHATARVGGSDDLPATLDQALYRFSMGPVPPGMRDPANDPNLAAYASSLLMATWGDWQAVHMRADSIPRVVDLYQSIIDQVGEPEANTISTIANMAGTAVNSLVLGYFVRQAEEADGRDRRLVRTWLDLLDEHAGPQTGTVVRGAWGILLRDVLELDARNECYQPFARCVDASVFGLEEV